MSRSAEAARTIVLEVLAGIAPEADLAALDPRANLRRALDLDSVDFQNFLIGLVKATGVDVPDRVAPTLVTVAACVALLTGEDSDGREGPGPPDSPSTVGLCGDTSREGSPERERRECG